MFTSTSATESSATPVRSAEDLERAYLWSINSAIENGGDVLADELAASYRCESHQLRQNGLTRSAA